MLSQLLRGFLFNPEDFEQYDQLKDAICHNNSIEENNFSELNQVLFRRCLETTCSSATIFPLAAEWLIRFCNSQLDIPTSSSLFSSFVSLGLVRFQFNTKDMDSQVEILRFFAILLSREEFPDPGTFLTQLHMSTLSGFPLVRFKVLELLILHCHRVLRDPDPFCNLFFNSLTMDSSSSWSPQLSLSLCQFFKTHYVWVLQQTQVFRHFRRLFLVNCYPVGNECVGFLSFLLVNWVKDGVAPLVVLWNETEGMEELQCILLNEAASLSDRIRLAQNCFELESCPESYLLSMSEWTADIHALLVLFLVQSNHNSNNKKRTDDDQLLSWTLWMLGKSSLSLAQSSYTAIVDFIRFQEENSTCCSELVLVAAYTSLNLLSVHLNSELISFPVPLNHTFHSNRASVLFFAPLGLKKKIILV